MASIIAAVIRDELSSFIFTVFLAAFAYILLLRWRKQQENLPPGPRGLPLLGSLPFLDPDLHRYFAELARTHGPVLSLRLGTKLCVVLSSPSAVREALCDRDAVFANHDPPAAALASSQGGKDMALAPLGPHWRVLRKVAVRDLLNTSGIESVYPLRRREVLRAVADLRARAGKAVEIRAVTYLVTLNMMTSMLWGADVSERSSVEFREVMDGIVELLGAPNVSDFFPILAPLDLQGVARRMRRLSAWFDRIFESIVEQRRGVRGDAGRSRDFLDVTMELVERGDTQAPLTMEHVNALFLVR